MALKSGTLRRYKDETGETYAKLTVLRFERTQGGRPYWACQCECGREVSVRGAHLRSGNTRSCGCSRTKPKTHGHGKMAMKTMCQVLVMGKGDEKASTPKWVTFCKWSRSLACARAGFHSENKLRRGKALLCECLRPTHNTWRKMIERCTNKNHKQFGDYGGRGITVCQRWRDSFSDFVDDMKPRPDEKTLDRIDNNAGYFKKNCRWATKKEQAANRRSKSILNEHL
jgi:hypothetical protein